MDPLTAGLIGLGMYISFLLGRADQEKPLPPPKLKAVVVTPIVVKEISREQ
jgi:hypothetical protein